MGTGGSFPGGKARPGRDADHSPPSSAEVKNEELYLLSPHVPPWRVAGQLYFAFIILPVFLYRCETWSLTLREEHRLRVFENRVFRRIFGPKRDEVTGGWRKLHNEELYGLYTSPSIISVIKARRMRWAGHVARIGEVRGAYNISVGRPEKRRPLGRPRHRWEDNIKMDLREIGFGDVD
jgi:hypothetical protein